MIHENYLSQKDIGICLGYKLESLSEEQAIDSIQTLHEVLKSEYVDNGGVRKAPG